MNDPNRIPQTVAVVGLGLIGGSLVRDLLGLGVRVLGYDRDEETVRAAGGAGVVPLAGVADPVLTEAELLVIALPVTAAVEMLRRVAPVLGEGCIVTDLGSTKRSIGRAAEEAGIGARFVGSHPMAGDHRSGWEVASRGLFSGARVYLCPTRETLPRTTAALHGLWEAVGARTEEVDAEEHDRRLAWTSHLPQIASSALAAVLADGGQRMVDLGRGGREFTRLAGSSPEMWEAICRDNADLLGPALAALEGEIASLRAALDRGDPDAVHQFFARANRWWWEGEGAP